MRSGLPNIVALLLALLIAGTSQTMATARGQAAVAGEIVLCIGAQTVVVTVDADGQPTEHPHICPDCALLLLVGLSAPHEMPPAVLRAAACHWPNATDTLGAPATREHRARAPPGARA